MDFNKIKTKIGIGLMVLAMGFMFWNVLVSKTAQAEENPYENEERSLEQVMSDYHKYMNDTFNTYIKKMLTESQKNPKDENGKPPEGPDAEKVCINKPENYSTYCVAIRLLGNLDDPKQQGYLNYKKALETRRNLIFDTAAERDAYNKFIAAVTCAGSTDPACTQNKTEKVESVYQAQKILSISDRTRAIDREIQVAKVALDKTLAAYDQLRLTFPMHITYRQIFNELVDYRDKLIELRDQTDDLPSKFVDVTTMKCT